MKNREKFNKEIILLEKSFVDCEPNDEICTEIEDEILKLIDENEYLSSKNDREKNIFYKLVSVCATFSKLSNGYVSARLYPNEDKALIFITAPSFDLSHPTLNKLYNIIIGASRMAIDTDKSSNNIRITVEFSFAKNAIRIIDLFEKLDKSSHNN